MQTSAKISSKEDATKTEVAKTKPANNVSHAPQQIPLWVDGALPVMRFSLKVNNPDDEYEQEADQIADQVMRMPNPGVQRCSCGGVAGPDGECATCRTKRLSIQRKASRADMAAREAPASVHQTISQSGQPLDHSTRRFMESRFGQDFGKVRVHTGSQASQSATDVNARAYTVGQNVVFGASQYTPGTHSGNRLIAHELAHTVQQTGRLSRQEKQSDPIHSGADPRKSPGSKIELYGIAYKKEGVNLRDMPGWQQNSKVLRRLAFNTRMYVDSEVDGHYFVGTDEGEFGYVSKTHVKTNLPEPDAKIYYIEPGDTALEISRKHYGGKAEWGQDHRFFVNGLVYVNKGKEGSNEPRGIYKPNQNADWDTTIVRAGYMIWIPSLKFMRSLQGVVKSGSITYEAWQTVKDIASAIGEFVLGYGAFVVGLLHGALESVWDVFVGLKDLAVMAVDLVKWLIKIAAGEGESLFDEIKKINWTELVKGWINDFLKKWNSGNILKKWHFRGWVIGYVIAEVLMMIFSGGIIQGIKWAGKSAKVAKVIAKFPRVVKLAEAAKSSKMGQAFSQAIETTNRARGKASKIISETGEKVRKTKLFTSLALGRKWAIATLKLPGEIMADLTLAGINKLSQLSEPVLSRISRLSKRAKKWLLGCASACKVNLDKIKKTLGEMADSEIEKAVTPAAPGIGESMIKAEKQTGISADIAAQAHKQKKTFRAGSGKLVESAHMVPTVAVKSVQGYSRSKALTILLPRKLHREFDKHWMDWARKRAKELRRQGLPEQMSVAEWETALNRAADSVPGLRGRTADTMSFMFRTEFYHTLGLNPTDMLPLPKFQ